MIEQLMLHGLLGHNLSVLLFHKVPRMRHPLYPDEIDLGEFERSIDFLQDRFRVLPLDEAVRLLGSGRLPRRSACITFDDGYPDWEHGVLPLLHGRRLPATFFVTAGQFLGQPMWNERILHALGNCPPGLPALNVSFLPRNMPLASVADRRRVLAETERALKYRSTAVREELLVELESALGVPGAATPRMSERQLRLIHDMGFEIGAHTVGHPILSCCTDDEARDEIGIAREVLAGITGSAIKSFAYPNGRPGRDFSARHIAIVKAAGYALAVTTGTGAARRNSSAFQIPRFTPWGPTRRRRAIQLARNILTRPRELSEQSTEAASRVLMVAFHFPPQVGSSGVLRTLNFIRHLPANGWQPTVLTAHPRAYESTDDALAGTIPKGVPVVRGFALDASRHLSLHGKYSDLLALPDRWAAWWLGGVAAGLKVIRKQHVGLIWSTYPIATSHLIGATLARITGLPWVADFRDPMVGNSAYQFSARQQSMARWLEALAMRRATRCVFTTAGAAARYRGNYPDDAAKCCVVENGYDEDAFAGTTALRLDVGADTLLMLHSGIIYPRDRDPTAFFAAVARLLADGGLRRDKLRIRFRASDHDGLIKEIAVAHGIGDVVDIAPAIPYREAIGEMLGADVLLAFQGSRFNAQIPAKIYEYLRARKPVLALVDPRGDTAGRLGPFAAAVIADIDSAESALAGLKTLLARLGSADAANGMERDAGAIAALARSSQTRQLAGLFRELAG